MTTDTTNIINILNILITTSKDSEQGFRSAADKVENQNLKDTFLSKADKCQGYITELQELVSGLNAEPLEDSGSMLGALHRGFLEVKSIITGNDDYAILVECERGEEVARNNYLEALKEDLPTAILNVIRRQYNEVSEDYAHISELKEKYTKNKDI
ncbi:MAG: PA2169 family four-helix-bundle protein [Rickettsia endosymbiont of Argas persicus]